MTEWTGLPEDEERWQRGFPLDLASAFSLSLLDYRPSLELVFIYRALLSHRVCGRLTLFFVLSFLFRSIIHSYGLTPGVWYWVLRNLSTGIVQARSEIRVDRLNHDR